MQDFTYHSHNSSQGIADGHNTCDEMLSRAEEIGFSEIGVSNHFIYHPNIKIEHSQDFNNFSKALDYAKNDIEQTREAASRHKIKVYAGFEVDFFPSKIWRDAFEKMLKEDSFQPSYSELKDRFTFECLYSQYNTTTKTESQGYYESTGTDTIEKYNHPDSNTRGRRR